MRRGPLLAVAISALLGVVAGAVSGLAVDRTDDTASDPLNLGVPQVNQQCTGQALLLVARGDGASELAATVATEGDDVRYLDTDKSCDTGWVGPGKPTPRYAAYLGPYSSPSQACPLRMTVAHQGSAVVQLISQTPEPVQCLCYLSFSSMPILRLGQDVSDSTGIWVRALQRMLTDLGRNPEFHQNGLYDLRTAQQVRQFQHDQGISPTGATNPQFWRVLTRHGCKAHPS